MQLQLRRRSIVLPFAIADVKAARDVNENNRNGGARRSEQPQSRRRTTRRRRRTTTTPGSRQGAGPVKAFFFQ